MSALLTIKGRMRTDEEKGKNVCRRLRLRGEVPANLIGKAKSTPIVVEAKMLSAAWKNGKTFQLELDGQAKAVVMKELQVDPVKRSALHLDLMYA